MKGRLQLVLFVAAATLTCAVLAIVHAAIWTPAWEQEEPLRVLTDWTTGCEYLLSDGSGLTARMNAQGRQRGCLRAAR